MRHHCASLLPCMLVAARAIAQSSAGVPLWGQCGGVGYTGPTQCAQPNFPQVLIECKPLGTYFSQCQDISDPACIKVACKCPVGYITEWYTGPEPKKCRMCNCVPVSTKPTPTPTLITTKPIPSSSSQVIYPYYPPAAITSSSCPPPACPKTCSAPAGSFSWSSTVVTPGTATICAQCYCMCPIWDCFCRPPAVFVPTIIGACSACTCSTPTQTLADPTAIPGVAAAGKEDLSIITTAFLEVIHQETPAADVPKLFRDVGSRFNGFQRKPA